jgi:hypothetical protein
MTGNESGSSATSTISEPASGNYVLTARLLDRTLLSLTLLLGLLHTWIGRYAMNPDGISYLDVGESFFRRDWAQAVNAWWSPLYAWMMGIVLGAFKPSPKWEFPLVQLANFGIFVLATLAFRFVLHGFMQSSRMQTPETLRSEEALPEWASLILGYSIFLWIALEVETVYDVSPDLLVLGCFCLTAGILLRLHPGDGYWNFASLGFILGVGYWAKAILFPLGCVTVGLAYWWRRSKQGWSRDIVVASLVFLCTSAPLIFLLSSQKGRFTFGDSGKVNYAWYVSPRTFTRNWQGAEPDSGIPKHATRQLLKHPPVFEFDGPVVGTYPPWTDPSYWNDGLQWHFKLKAQLEVLMTTLPSELRLLLRDRPELILGIIVLALLSGRLWFERLRELWFFIVLPIVGMTLYLPVVENDRYLGGFVLVFFLALLAAVRLRPEDQRSARILVAVTFVMMMMSTGDYTVRVFLHHMAISGNGPNSTVQDITAAEELRKMGLAAGTKVAIIGDGTGAYWAHLGEFRIVAEIMGTNHGPREFWDSSFDVQQQVYKACQSARAKLIVTSCPSWTLRVPEGWGPIPGTPYCMHTLQ